ncbi:hypothetical protein DSM14862_03533 (plasmid) [Sulfitobacter indolifex]|nr:hypothetical protein DSM14862_03533 [Sulfitobacter indolifex]
MSDLAHIHSERPDQKLAALFITLFLAGIFLSSTIPSNAFLAITWFLAFATNYRCITPYVTKRTIQFVLILFFAHIWIYVHATYLAEPSFIMESEGFSKRILFTPIYSILFLLLVKDSPKLLIRSIEILLKVFVALWFLQFFATYITGDFLDYLKILGIRAQKGSAYFLNGGIFGFKVWRPTSLFNEPGSYAAAVFPLLALDYYAKNKHLTRLHKLTLISFGLCLSAFAMLLASAFLIARSLERARQSPTKKVWFLITLLIILVPLYYYYEIRFVGNELRGGLEFRTTIFQDFWAQDLTSHLFGNSFTTLEIIDSKTRVYRVILQDLSFLFYAWYSLGLLFVFLIVWLFRTSVHRSRDFWIFFPVMLSKVSITTYFLWISLVSMHIISTQWRSKS